MRSGRAPARPRPRGLLVRAQPPSTANGGRRSPWFPAARTFEAQRPGGPPQPGTAVHARACGGCGTESARSTAAQGRRTGARRRLRYEAAPLRRRRRPRAGLGGRSHAHDLRSRRRQDRCARAVAHQPGRRAGDRRLEVTATTATSGSPRAATSASPRPRPRARVHARCPAAAAARLRPRPPCRPAGPIAARPGTPRSTCPQAPPPSASCRPSPRSPRRVAPRPPGGRTASPRREHRSRPSAPSTERRAGTTSFRRLQSRSAIAVSGEPSSTPSRSSPPRLTSAVPSGPDESRSLR